MAWLHEINRELVKRIGQYLNKDRDLNTPIEVRYTTPDNSNNRPSHPDGNPVVLVKLYNLSEDSSRVTSRTWTGTEIVGEDDDTIELRKMPIPYWLYYEFSLIAQSNKDMIDITSRIMSLFPSRCTLPVEDEEGNEQLHYMEMSKFNDPSQRDRFRTQTEERQRRTLRSTLRYKISAKLPRVETEEYFKVKKVEIGFNIEENETETTTVGEGGDD